MHYRRYLQAMLVMALFQWSFAAQAIPAFARAEGVNCSTCHNAWPQLNAKGRAFKENGYRFDADLGDHRSLKDLLEEGAPIGTLLIARPYDKKESGDIKNRAMHEVELFIGAALNDKWSGYAEFEAEDEGAFTPIVGNATVGYHLNKAINFQMSWSPYMWADGYGFLGDRFRMTRGHVKAFDEKFGGADAKLRSARQLAAIYGRPMDNLFYSIGYSGKADDYEGEDAKNFHGRIAIDLLENLMVGAFQINGEGSGSRGFSRTGLDMQYDFGGARLQAAYVTAKDDDTGGGDTTNNAFSLQGMYVLKHNGHPAWVPLVRLDQYERNDGADDYTELTLNVTRYFSENIKGYLEFWQQMDVPAGSKEDSRVTLQLAIGF